MTVEVGKPGRAARQHGDRPWPHCDCTANSLSAEKGLEVIFIENRVPERIRDIPFGTLFFGGIGLVLAVAALLGVLLA